MGGLILNESIRENKMSTPGQADKPFTDPVCGMKVAADPQKEAQYQGQTYYFCSERCLGKFKASPAAYVTPRESEHVAAAPEGTIYTARCTRKSASRCRETAPSAA
jgi:YHS domain-containing protein